MEALPILSQRLVNPEGRLVIALSRVSTYHPLTEQCVSPMKKSRVGAVRGRTDLDDAPRATHHSAQGAYPL